MGCPSLNRSTSAAPTATPGFLQVLRRCREPPPPPSTGAFSVFRRLSRRLFLLHTPHGCVPTRRSCSEVCNKKLTVAPPPPSHKAHLPLLAEVEPSAWLTPPPQQLPSTPQHQPTRTGSKKLVQLCAASLSQYSLQGRLRHSWICAMSRTLLYGQRRPSRVPRRSHRGRRSHRSCARVSRALSTAMCRPS